MKKESRKPGPVIVLAMHGAPPLDFPRDELAEFFGLSGRLGHAAGPAPAAAGRRLAELERKMLAWPRSAKNDPFYGGSLELAGELRRASGLEVVVGFNEFCPPTLAEALDRAAASAPKILVITPMMTRGGEHSAADIPQAVRAAESRHPGTRFVYVWPFPTEDVARFLAAQISRRV